MKYNSHIIPVFTRFNSDDVYTEGDIVFGIDTSLTNYNPLVLMKCIKKTIKGVAPSSTYFEPYTTSAYANAAKTYEQYTKAASDTLVTKGAITETLERLVGKNLNSNGTNKYLPSGADFNTMENDGRWLLNPSSKYFNLPVILDKWTEWIAVIYESYNLDNLNVQILTCFKSVTNWIILRRAKVPTQKWDSILWTTDQGSPAYSSFITEYNGIAASYLESLRLLNAKADSIRGTSVSIVGAPNNPGFYNLPCRFKALSLPDGYFEIQVLTATLENDHAVLNNNEEQTTASFTSEDIDYVRYNKSSIRLASNNDSIELTLSYAEDTSTDTYVDGTEIEAKDVVLTINGTGIVYAKILRLPLKIAENG